MRQFDADILGVITTFENITGTEVRDCVNSERIYFLVNPGKVAVAIGKNGVNIRSAEKRMRKPIKVMEWSEDEKTFVKNMIPQSQKIKIEKGKAIVNLNSKDRGIVIGKNGANIKIIRELLERNSNLKELKIF